ncbi:MAG TPA: hypothetical protein VHB02_14005 [Acidimicrobiales bacterium]|nr:hypothetical protein [Acidimicrobiales bacterium]
MLDVVRSGEPVVITDRGTPMARLEAVADLLGTDPRLVRLERAGPLRRGTGGVVGVLGRLGPPPALSEGGDRGAVEVVLEERRTGR